MKGEDGGPLLREAVEPRGWRRRPGKEARRNQEAGLPCVTSPRTPPRTRKFKTFRLRQFSAFLSHSSFRQASPHYRHNLFKSSTAFSPHSSVLPTTTSASSSDLRSRIFVFETTPSSSAFCHTRTDTPALGGCLLCQTSTLLPITIGV